MSFASLTDLANPLSTKIQNPPFSQFVKPIHSSSMTLCHWLGSQCACAGGTFDLTTAFALSFPHHGKKTADDMTKAKSTQLKIICNESFGWSLQQMLHATLNCEVAISLLISSFPHPNFAGAVVDLAKPQLMMVDGRWLQHCSSMSPVVEKFSFSRPLLASPFCCHISLVDQSLSVHQ